MQIDKHNDFVGHKLGADWIRDLESSNSRNHKKKVIEKALVAANLGSASAQCFLFNCYQAYNPFYIFNIQKVPTTEGLENCANPWPKFWALLESLRTRSVTGNRAKLQIEELSKEFDSVEWNQMARRVLLKDLRCGISDRTLNDVLVNTQWKIPKFSCQLANDSNSHGSPGLKRLEIKLDGVRVLALVSQDGVQLLSRNGRVFDNFVEIQNAIQNYWEIFQSHYLPFTLNGSFVLDGEIVGKNFQQLMTQARRKTNVQTVDMTYYVFDVIPLSAFMKGQWNQSQQARSEFLERLQPKLTQNQLIQIMPGIVVDTKTSEGKVILERFARHAVEEGHEGIMIKDLDAPYVCTRNTSWLKWKPVITVDLAVTEVVAGTGRNSDRLGALVCQGIDDGRAICVNVGSGFSDQNRDEFWKYRAELIDQIVEIRADAVTQNQDGSYSLRFPRFVRFRGFQPKEKF